MAVAAALLLLSGLLCGQSDTLGVLTRRALLQLVLDNHPAARQAAQARQRRHPDAAGLHERRQFRFQLGPHALIVIVIQHASVVLIVQFRDLVKQVLDRLIILIHHALPHQEQEIRGLQHIQGGQDHQPGRLMDQLVNIGFAPTFFYFPVFFHHL